MFVLLFALLGGCLWAKADKYEVWLDDLDAARVTLDAQQGTAMPLVAGTGDGSTTIPVAGRYQLEFRRYQGEGVRIVCEQCQHPMLAVDPDGKIHDDFDARAVVIDPGHAVTVYRPYYLYDYEYWNDSWWGTTYWSGSSAVRVGIGADWDDVRRIQARQRPMRGIGWVAMGASWVTQWVSWVFLAQQKWAPGLSLFGLSIPVGVWGGFHAFRPARRIEIYQDPTNPVPESDW